MDVLLCYLCFDYVAWCPVYKVFCDGVVFILFCFCCYAVGLWLTNVFIWDVMMFVLACFVLFLVFCLFAIVFRVRR